MLVVYLSQMEVYSVSESEGEREMALMKTYRYETQTSKVKFCVKSTDRPVPQYIDDSHYNCHQSKNI